MKKMIKGCWERYKSTKNPDHVADIFRLINYFVKKKLGLVENEV